MPLYRPEHFRPPDDDVAWALIERHPFATLISGGTDPHISHVPLLAVRDERGPKLIGHVARKNPHWRELRANPRALAVFHGPNAYITPNWYGVYDVPTWNYAVVHVRAEVALLEEPRDLVRILALLTERFESGPDGWRFGLPDDLQDEGALAAAIVGFELTGLELEAKFKLNQNRSAEDRAGVRAGLATRADAGSAGILALMRELEP